MAAGVAVGLVFDIYRSLRSWWGLGAVLTFSTDLIFSVAALAILIYFFVQAHAYTFRMYMVGGSVLGLMIYLHFCSRWIMWFIFGVLESVSTILHFLGKGLKIPWRGLILIMERPYRLLRWFSLFLYRLGEATVGRSLKQGMGSVYKWFKSFFLSGKKG